MRTDEDSLRLTGVTVKHRGGFVLDRVDLTVPRGSFTALIGPNGSGKTTLLRAIAGHDRTVGGSIQLGTIDLSRLSSRERARQVASVPQMARLPQDLQVYDLVMMGRTPYLSRWGVPGEKDRCSVREALHSVRATSYSNRCVGEISGGELQRALVARALSQGSDVLLLDEATAHLDVRHQLEILETCVRIVRERGLILLAAIHDLNLAARFADNAAIISAGRVVAQGSPNEVLSEAVVRDVFGLPVQRVSLADGWAIFPRIDKKETFEHAKTHQDLHENW